MQRSNNPDIALAQEWFEEVQAWFDRHGTAGYDPFDIKQHAWIKAAQQHPLRRKLTSGLCDLFPYAVRSRLNVEKTENPKTHALLALAHLRLHAVDPENGHTEHARRHLDWLAGNAVSCGGGIGWGYPFDVSGTGVNTPKNTPVAVVSAIAGDAFLRAYEITRDAVLLENARAIARFICTALPRMEDEEGAYCFGYTPGDRRRVHNANLLAAEHLFRVWAATGDDDLLRAAEPALAFTLRRQRGDGAWPYGEYAPGEPFEESLMRLVDNHHTGFVLRSLYGIYRCRPESDLQEAVQRGFKFYRSLFTDAGMPITAQGAYPVDIHACAEGILCPSLLSDAMPSAKTLAVLVLRWTWFQMRDRETGAPYYRQYRRFTSKIAYPRWGAAWICRALAEYVVHFHDDRERVDGINVRVSSWLH